MNEQIDLYVNGVIFPGRATNPLASAFAVQNGRVLAVGETDQLRLDFPTDPEGMTETDLGGALVTPGITEGHAHMLMLGEALGKVQLRDAETLAEVQQRLRTAREQHPEATRITGVGWRFDIFADGAQPAAEMLDEAVADVPVLLDANDLHSAWVNTAALDAMGITDETPDPVGGRIVRDSSGHATGFLLETAAMTYCWQYLESVATDRDRDHFLSTAFHAYLEAGVTGATEMSFGQADLATYKRMLDRDGRLPFPVSAYWLLSATGDHESDLAQIREVARIREDLAESYGTDWLQIVGVKFILDGVIDACTAAMCAPYANGELPRPIWEREFALPAAVAADAAGLDLAMHAIGDLASEIALDMVAECHRVNGSRATRRPRVEHLESVQDATIARMATLGVIASMQPVHCDPAIMDNWQRVLGDERAESGFPWDKFRRAGIRMALGTDAPTAPHDSRANLFIALTAKSALEAHREAYHPERVFTPLDALEGFTFGTAYAAKRDDHLGQLTPGYRANFVIWEVNPLTESATSLLEEPGMRAAVDGELAASE